MQYLSAVIVIYGTLLSYMQHNNNCFHIFRQSFRIIMILSFVLNLLSKLLVIWEEPWNATKVMGDIGLFCAVLLRLCMFRHVAIHKIPCSLSTPDTTHETWQH